MNSFFARERGSTTVEFALTAPLVFMILLATLDFGRALSAYMTVGNGAREGLRYASRDLRAVANIEGMVERHSAPLAPSLLDVTAEYSNDDGLTWIGWSTGGAGSITAGRTLVRVEVTYPWAAVTTLVGGFFEAGSGGRTFTSRATGRAEGNR